MTTMTNVRLEDQSACHDQAKTGTDNTFTTATATISATASSDGQTINNIALMDTISPATATASPPSSSSGRSLSWLLPFRRASNASLPSSSTSSTTPSPSPSPTPTPPPLLLPSPSTPSSSTSTAHSSSLPLRDRLTRQTRSCSLSSSSSSATRERSLLHRMVKLNRNQSMPLSSSPCSTSSPPHTSPGLSLRKHTSQVFSGWTGGLGLQRTASIQNLHHPASPPTLAAGAGVHSPVLTTGLVFQNGHPHPQHPSLGRTRSSSMGSSSQQVMGAGVAVVALAPIITAIQRGNFVLVTEMDVDVLLREIANARYTTPSLSPPPPSQQLQQQHGGDHSRQSVVDANTLHNRGSRQHLRSSSSTMTSADKLSRALESLHISSVTISAADGKILSRLVKSSEVANIQTLKLDNNAMSFQASKILFEGWKLNRTITCLSLSRSGATDKTIKYLAKVLAKNMVLKELDLSGNRITAQGMDILGEAMVVNRSVTRLCLQSNNIKKGGAPTLAKILTKNRVLRHLNVGSNGLEEEGVVLIAEAVRFNRTLNSLSLDMNEMGPRGAGAIAKALISNRHLTHLYLPHNNIGDQGMVDICTSLMRNRYLISLDVELNHIGGGGQPSLEAVQTLATVLRMNTSLREINLAFNVFSTEAIQVLAEGLAGNSTIENVVLTNCCLSTEGAVAMAKVLPLTRGLQNLALTSNPEIGVEGYWALANGLVTNRSLKGIQLDYNSEDRQVWYESIQNSLTRNHIWQQAIYQAACRILTLSRLVLLGRPGPLLEKDIRGMTLPPVIVQQAPNTHINGSGNGTWNLLKRVKMGGGRTESSGSLTSILSLGKRTATDATAEGSLHPAGGNNQDPAGISSSSLSVASNQSHGNTHSRHGSIAFSLLSLDPEASATLATSTNVITRSRPTSFYRGSHLLVSSSSASPSSFTSSSSPYSHPERFHYDNPHKILAHLANMPYEIFETICAFLDPGRTMSIGQIRATVQVAGDRSTLVAMYTRERMLERIFDSRYISPVGVRYGLKPLGDERV